MAIRFERRFIGPVEAKELLAHRNPRNRRLRRTWVSRLVADLRVGALVVMHQPLAFFPNGDVMDGQHRLAAVAESDVGAWFTIATYESQDEAEAAWRVLDRGAKRSLGDQSVMVGDLPNNGADRIATAKVMHAIDASAGNNASDTMAVAKAREDVEAFDRLTHLLGSDVRSPYLAAFLWCHKFSPGLVEDIAAKCGSGIGLGPSEAKLRDFVREPMGSADGAGRLGITLKTMRLIEACAKNEILFRLEPQTREVIVRRLRAMRWPQAA
jgi:hypothetical protein